MHNRMMMYWKWLTASFTLVLIAAVFTGGYLLGAHAPNESAGAQGHQPPETEELFAPFWETWTLLHENYVDPLDDEELMESALRGMMQSLGDPNTDYMDPDMYSRVNESMSGEYEGIGASVRKDETTGGLELVSIFDGSPAAAAGLRPGDQIIEVNGEDITDLAQEEIIALVRGPAGTEVTLGILRADEPDLLDINVMRGRITVSTVIARVLDGAIGYVRLSQFDFETGGLMREALEEMDVESLNGLILDVRGDPGGYLTTAIDVASAFIDEGAVVTERSPDSEFTHMARGDAVAPEVPMVVLVDQGSASASELIAGALQDHERATIVGMPTFGKGSVQTWRELSNGGGVRITISRWYTPDGHSVSEVGIEPDIEVPFDPEAALTGADNQLDTAIAILNGTYEPNTVLDRESVEPALP
jgi:carboxyl-terminal processing protease